MSETLVLNGLGNPLQVLHLILSEFNPTGNYMFKVNNKNTRTKYEIYFKVNNKDTRTTPTLSW